MSLMKELKPAEIKVLVPAGEYFLCDPCYSVPKEHWHQLLHTCDFFNRPVGTMTVDEEIYSILGFRTTSGDGIYRDQYGFSYPVDAGLIGLTPASIGEDPGDFGQLIKFERDIICTDNNGDLRFGKYRINTNDEEDWDDIDY